MENEFYEEDGVSLGQIFKVMFLRWKLLLIITASVFIVGMLGTQLIYNRMKAYYSTSVEYVNVINDDEETFVNNSKFNYRDIIKLDNLKAIKSSDTKFDSINIEKLVDEEDISISKTINEQTKKSVYTVKVKGKYFNSSETAKEFLNKLLNSPVNELSKLVENANNKLYLTGYDNSIDYESQIEALYDEISLIDSKYTKLLDIYVEAKVDDKDMASIQIALQNKYGKTVDEDKKVSYKVIDDLKNELLKKNFVKDFDKNKNALINEKEALEKQINDNNDIIKALEDKIDLYNTKYSNLTNDAYTPITTEITKLITENSKMNNQILVIQSQLDNNGGDATERAAFEAKLTALYNELKTEANNYTTNSKDVVNLYAKAETNGKALTSTGDLGIIISALLSLVAGLIIACIVNLIIDREKLKPGYFDKDNNSKKEESLIENKEE